MKLPAVPLKLHPLRDTTFRVQQPLCPNAADSGRLYLPWLSALQLGSDSLFR